MPPAITPLVALSVPVMLASMGMASTAQVKQPCLLHLFAGQDLDH